MTSQILKNPFYVLGVSVRDDRRRILELAEERYLEIGEERSQSARAQLTSPRARLNAEIAWLPGLSPRRVEQLIRVLHSDPGRLRSVTGLPNLAQLNLLVASFEVIDPDMPRDEVSDFIVEIALLTDGLDPEVIRRDISEDRVVSGFSEIRSVDQVQVELSERKRQFREAITIGLNRLATDTLVGVMTEVLEKATIHGERLAPELIDDLVDGYEAEVQGFLAREAENVEKVLGVARELAPRGETVLLPLIDKIEEAARNWDRVAQPIQLSCKARGIAHDASHALAYSIRDVAIDLWNKHGLLAASRRLIQLARELFAELPEFSERVNSDADVLKGIQDERIANDAAQKDWERELSFRAEIGILFKSTLSISTGGITWKGKTYPLESITRLRWGGVKHSVNYVPTGTTYTIGFGDRHSEAVIELRNKDVYSDVIDRLWKAAGVRLLTELLRSLREGREVVFGLGSIRDDGAVLIKSKVFGSAEKVFLPWSGLHVWSADGQFNIGAKEDKKAYIAASYIDRTNTHVFEQAIRLAFKHPNMRRLSDLLDRK